MKTNRFDRVTFSVASSAMLFFSGAVHAQNVRVTITNNAPDGGVHVTPVWAGFHDGSFDSYDGGLASQPGLERIAEDGDMSVISGDFLSGLTYIDGNGDSATVETEQEGSLRVDGGVGGSPVGPAQSVETEFTIDMMGANRYFSYAAMVLPSNDYYVANGNPLAHDLAGLYDAPAGTSVTFEIGLDGTINDAGTELNFANIDGAGDTEDATVAGLGLLGDGYVGQSAPDTGTSEMGVNANVLVAYAEAPSIAADHPDLDFNDTTLYPNGIATVTITVVGGDGSTGDEEPTGGSMSGICGAGSVAMVPLMLGAMLVSRGRRRTRIN